MPWTSVILDIARACEANNPAMGLSGMLIFSRDYYLHFVEGPTEAVEQIVGKLATDTRHDPVWTVRGTAPDPRLAGLPMGYFDADRESAQATTLPLWTQRQEWEATDAPALIELLVQIAREKYPAALSGDGTPEV